MSCKTFVIFATDSPQYAAIGWKSPQFWVQFWPPGLIGPLPMQSIHNIELLTFVKTEQFVLLWGASEPEWKNPFHKWPSINGQGTQNLENYFWFKILSTLSEIRNLTAKRYWHLVQILSVPTKNWPATRKIQDIFSWKKNTSSENFHCRWKSKWIVGLFTLEEEITNHILVVSPFLRLLNVICRFGWGNFGIFSSFPCLRS